MPIYYDNQKRYNTHTAHLIFEFENGLPYTDFDHHSWDLYLTPKSAFFAIDNQDRLEVLTEQEAYDRVELVAAGSDVLEKYFSHMIEDA